MRRPVVIVDPVDSGAALAPAFAARGVPAIAVRSMAPEAWARVFEMGYASRIQAEDFQAIHDPGPQLEALLREAQPLAVLAGSESGVDLADRLAAALTPGLANRPELRLARRHKGQMQAALAAAGLPHIRSLEASQPAEVQAWLAEQGLAQAGLVLKPVASAGSDHVLHVPPGRDWRRAFDRIRASRTKLRDEANATVLVQEQLLGTEYAVDAVSAEGRHHLAHLIRYSKTAAGDRLTVFDHTEFLPFEPEAHGAMWAYVQAALDAVGIRWGAAHCEVMLTAQGPRLIEVGARTCGGPVLGFSRVATGSSQLERVVEAYVDGRVSTTEYAFRQTVVPVFLIAPHEGRLQGVAALEAARELPTHLATHMWFQDGDTVPQTVDFDTVLGVVALAGPREAVFADLARVREVEARLRILP